MGMGSEGTGEPTVLIVEDDVDLAETFAIWLSGEYDVRTAHSEADALETYDRDVDIVLLDRRLPKSSGDEVLDSVRNAGGESLIGMVTAVEPDVDLADLPVDDYIVKPVGREDLTSFVEALEGRRRYSGAVREAAARVARADLIESHADPQRIADSDAFSELVADLEALREVAAEADPSDAAQAIHEATDGSPDSYTE